MIAFIDTEVNPQTKKVDDYGALREDGALLLSHSKTDFDAFVSGCDTICGHNIIGKNGSNPAKETLRKAPYKRSEKC